MSISAGNATPIDARMMWKPSVNAIWLRAASSCEASITMWAAVPAWARRYVRPRPAPSPEPDDRLHPHRVMTFRGWVWSIGAMITALRPQAREAPSRDGQAADVFVVFGITGDLAKVMTFRSL